MGLGKVSLICYRFGCLRKLGLNISLSDCLLDFANGGHNQHHFHKGIPIWCLLGGSTVVNIDALAA